MSSLAEPVPRKDGKCVVCRKPIPKTASRYAAADAFCSRRCAQIHHGTELEVDVDTGPSVLSQRVQAAKR